MFGKTVRDFHAGVFRAVLRHSMGSCTIHHHFLWMQGIHAMRTRLMDGSLWTFDYYRNEVTGALASAA
jgi:hypothetical protein